ncbi:MAG: 2-hydroxymuconate tautomerase family protein [Acidocella sp.]|nr:2-hydroxymuconate tautomerase family protein [Acidocella sp.]
MPIVEITLIEGRSFELKEKLVKEVTQAVVSSIGAPKEAVRVILREVPPWHFGAGGEVKGKPPEATE